MINSFNTIGVQKQAALLFWGVYFEIVIKTLYYHDYC